MVNGGTPECRKGALHGVVRTEPTLRGKIEIDDPMLDARPRVDVIINRIQATIKNIGDRIRSLDRLAYPCHVPRRVSGTSIQTITNDLRI